MARRRKYLTAEEVREIQNYLKKCTDARTRIRLSAVLMYETGVPIREILERFDCSRSSLLNWCNAVRSEGWRGAKPQWTGGHNAKLSPEQVTDLAIRLDMVTPNMVFGESASDGNGEHWTVEDLYRAVKLWYGVVYRSRSSYYNLLNRCQTEQEQISELFMSLSPAYSPSD